MAKKTASTEGDVIVIKKYANRRLYNTATSSYVTLDHLCEMVKKGQDFVVHDAKTNEDITRSVLAQIIFEEEGKSGQNLLPIKFLRQIIRFYGDSLQGFIPSYLELSMDAFSREQEKMRSKIASAFTGGPRLGQFEDQIRQNFAMFDSAMRMFSPFAPRTKSQRPDEEQTPEAAGSEAEPTASAREREIEELKRQMSAMQEQLESLVKK
ncbi:polyhydroxyalkanoate synthesis repressor PhaR [Parvibaculum sedimenti]|uniref:Polyhydroxyalkanoate synthesis repressor PhaR n=1 Tax=Parvibaculum sedimenti TaxID=2608632 RepID=A0A6N6VLY0_9HYPH|nr:polyhydroxyalkanoate synthesis repressor PhaR [Parvibaculum sedimenti]KAB7742059.1 polyhydroxyalkanoate synthesis repressor PhaR [Parvibaculum sedimenti]